MKRHFVMFLSCALCFVAVSQSPDAWQVAGHDSVPGHRATEFDTSDKCLACHNGLTTAAGEDVSIGTQWRASMMANSARDPYWQAAVRREIIDHPQKRDVIEDECAICHMPMARVGARESGRRGEVIRLLPSQKPGGDEHRLAADGVSCSLCHQMARTGWVRARVS